MNGLDIANQYFDAWNAHDADAIIRTFANDGTYCDPNTSKISGNAIGANAKSLWKAFPNLSFEIVSITEAGSGKVVAEWLMKGRNIRAFQGLPATGRRISLPGAYFIEVGKDGIKSVKGYFDTKTISEQLGLQVLIQPFKLGGFSFGNSVAVQSGKKVKPGAFGITTLWNKDEDSEEIQALSRDIAKEMLSMDGFIGLTLVRIGGRGITISAWEKPENTKQLMRGGTHQEAIRRSWDSLSQSAYTSVWIPDRINRLWIRCNTCNKMNDYEKNSGLCTCGQPLPEAPSYF